MREEEREMKSPRAVILCKFSEGDDEPLPKSYYRNLFTPSQTSSSFADDNALGPGARVQRAANDYSASDPESSLIGPGRPNLGRGASASRAQSSRHRAPAAQASGRGGARSARPRRGLRSSRARMAGND